MRLRSASPWPRMFSDCELASASSTVTSRSALARISWLFWLPWARNSAASRCRSVLHALIDRLAVLFRKVDTADADINHLDAERLRVAIELIAHLRHQILAAVTHRVGQRRGAKHAAQCRIEQNRKLCAGAFRADGL